MTRFIFFLSAFILFGFSLAAQQKKNLTPHDYSKWQSIGSDEISPNGDWLAYLVLIAEDNDTLFVVNRKNDKKYKLAFSSMPEFSKDNKWIAFRVGLPFKEADKLRDQGKPVEYKMGLLNLETGKQETIQGVSRFGFSKNGKFLAVLLDPAKGSTEKGNVLLLKNLTDSSTHTIGNVTEYAFNKKSTHLAYIIQSVNSAGNSVELLALSNYGLKILASDTLKFSKLHWQKEGDGLVFFKTTNSDKYEEENAVVYAYTHLSQTPTLTTFDPLSSEDFPKGMRIYNGSRLGISDDQSSVFFGLKTWTPKKSAPEKKPGTDSLHSGSDSTQGKGDSARTSVAQKESKSEKLAAVDIWHWNDPEVQPRQKKTYEEDKEASYLSAWNLDNKHFYQLAKENIPDAQLSGNQKYAIISTHNKYKPAFKEDFSDCYLVNVKTGEQKLLFEKMLAGEYQFPESSPDGKYLYYFKDKNWWIYTIANGQNLNLTQKIPSAFWNTRDDHPASRPPFGMGGWTKGDREMLVYDEYNVWAFKPDGQSARKISDGEKEEIRFRVEKIDYEEAFLDDTKPIILSAYGDKTKKFGYYEYVKGKTEKLIFEDLFFSRLEKAEDANVYSYIKQDYHISPQLFVADNFSNEKNILSTNPQQKDFYWGKSELISFTNTRGQKLQGALFYPANYEPGKKYPMVVYIYEILSNTLHNYVNPGNRSPYNTTNFTTGGYFIFRPDIVYEINDPGMSAVNCVVPAVKEVLKTGMIDEDKIGLMGHSWGAYQTSFIITQTNLFHAACAGAPLTDMISMSMSIYWNQGITDQKIFETSQGRFDGPWYDRMQEHIRNSPMFNAEKINTPFLVAFGDKDGAVDWHQGIEMYGTLRRMMKPHVMLVYADENHGLAKKENQIDYQTRQRQWFDHYLLGKPAEKWITEGVSYLEKMKEREKQNEQKDK